MRADCVGPGVLAPLSLWVLFSTNAKFSVVSFEKNGCDIADNRKNNFSHEAIQDAKKDKRETKLFFLCGFVILVDRSLRIF
jgi:hypothetical protein